MKKWLGKLFLVLAAVFVMSPMIGKDVSAASYKAVNADSYYSSAERTVDGHIFEIQYSNQKNTLYSTYKGSRQALVSARSMSYTIVTNGTTVYLGVRDTASGNGQIMSVKSDGTGLTTLKKFKCPDGFDLCGYYNGKLYLTNYKLWDYSTLQSYTVKTKKMASILKNAGTARQYGKYFYLRPIRGDVAPLKFRVYNAKTGKVQTITNKMASYDIVGGKLYYAEYIKCDSTYGKHTIRIKRASLSGSGKKTLVKELKALYVYEFGQKSVKYYNHNNVLKTKKY